MLPRNHPDRIQIAFDDHRLVANAGLLLPVTLAHHLGLSQLLQERLDLGNAPGRANTGDKVMTLVASALAGGDCIDDADALRTGGTARTLGGTVKAPSTLGTFLRSFRWGHVRQLDRVSRELLARAWATGAGPGDGPLTIDLDSTICETGFALKVGVGAKVARLMQKVGWPDWLGSYILDDPIGFASKVTVWHLTAAPSTQCNPNRELPQQLRLLSLHLFRFLCTATGSKSS